MSEAIRKMLSYAEPPSPRSREVRRELKALVNDLNNRELDVASAKRTWQNLVSRCRALREEIAEHPAAPKKESDRLAITIGMDRPGRGYWTFILLPGGTIERVRSLHDQADI